MNTSRALTWRRSVRSTSQGNNCVELADASGRVAVRDSKNPDAGHLTVSRAEFGRLIDQIKRS